MTTFVVFVLMSAAIWAALACLSLHVWGVGPMTKMMAEIERTPVK
jgi:hypothetical protein